MKRTLILLSFVTASLLTSCAQKGQVDQVVTIHTKFGDIVAILYDETPKHKANFLKLAKEQKFYDSLLFHRIMPGFMIQGGDPLSKIAPAGQPLGQGDPGYMVDAEFNPKFFHKKGALAAARTSDNVNPERKSSGSQFYIVQGQVIPEGELRNDQRLIQQGLQMMYQDPTNKPMFDTLEIVYNAGDMRAYSAKLNGLVPRIEKATGLKIAKVVSDEKVEAYTTVGGAPFLDDQYTVFGQVIQGFEVIDKIAEQPRAGHNRADLDRPLEDIRMTVTVEEMPRSKVTSKYGYKYTN